MQKEWKRENMYQIWILEKQFKCWWRCTVEVMRSPRGLWKAMRYWTKIITVEVNRMNDLYRHYNDTLIYRIWWWKNKGVKDNAGISGLIDRTNIDAITKDRECRNRNKIKVMIISSLLRIMCHSTSGQRFIIDISTKWF